MKRISVDLTTEDARHLERIVAYFRSGRTGIGISPEDAVRVAVRKLAERCRPDRIINDCGFTGAERRSRDRSASSGETP